MGGSFLSVLDDFNLDLGCNLRSAIANSRPFFPAVPSQWTTVSLKVERKEASQTIKGVKTAIYGVWDHTLLDRAKHHPA